MAAAAAALANSLGAASCGMGSPGVSQSNPLLGQYAALLGLARSPSGGPGTLACPLPCFTLVSMLNVAHSLMGQNPEDCTGCQSCFLSRLGKQSRSLKSVSSAIPVRILCKVC